LSIVLVIIGLIVGGILVGRNLIEAANMRAVNSDVEQITTAVNTFQLKYNCLPGDCANATQFWGQGVCNQTALTSQATCNGNGDGKIIGIGYGGGSSTDGWEGRIFWHHLQIAGLLNLPLSSPGLGIGFGGSQGVAGVNVPMSRWNGTSLYEVAYDSYMQAYAGTRVPGNIFYGHSVLFGPNELFTGGFNWPTPGLTPQQAQAFDTKFDDGYANSGAIIGWSAGGNTACYLITSAQPVTYSFTGYGYCELVFPRRF
jgi:hypothetical protein